MKHTYILLIVFLYLSCSIKNDKEKHAGTEKIDLITENTDSLHIRNKDNSTESMNILMYNMQVYASSPKQVAVTSSGLLINQILCVDPNPEELQINNKNIFDIRKDTIENSEGIFYIYKLTYKDSFIKVFYNEVTSSDDIVSAIIRDNEIKMINNIHIGMSKKTFSEKVLENSIELKSDIFINQDEAGDIKQTFYFANDELKEIRIESVYDWIDFEF